MEKLPESLFSIADLFQHTSLGGVIVLFLVAAPVVVACWLYVMNQMRATKKQKLYTSIGVVIVMISGVIYMKYSESKFDRLTTAYGEVLDHLESEGHINVGFKEFRGNAKVDYSDDLLKSVAYYSDTLVLVKLNGKVGPYYDTIGLQYANSRSLLTRDDSVLFFDEKLKNYMITQNKNAIGFCEAQTLLGLTSGSILVAVVRQSSSLGFTTFIPGPTCSDSRGIALVKRN